MVPAILPKRIRGYIALLKSDLRRRSVMRWAVLLVLASDSSCPTGYLQLALQRAHMCEALSEMLKVQSAYLKSIASAAASFRSLMEVRSA